MILKRTSQFLLVMILIAGQELSAQVINDGIDLSIGNLYMLSDAKTRSISPENFTGDKGKGGMAVIENFALPNVANTAAYTDGTFLIPFDLKRIYKSQFEPWGGEVTVNCRYRMMLFLLLSGIRKTLMQNFPNFLIG